MQVFPANFDHVSSCSNFLLIHLAGMTSKRFLEFFDIQELECSGAMLPPGADLFSMVLYDKDRNKVLALVNLRKRECSTSDYFISCSIDNSDSRNSKVSALVLGLTEGKSANYGCNMSILAAGGSFQVVSSSLTLRHISKAVDKVKRKQQSIECNQCFSLM